MSFSEDFIEKVRDASDLVDFISQDTQLKSSGSGTQLMGVCPFPDHNEKTPSFSVNSAKQVYHCFGCQKGGNIYHYLRDMRGLSFPEAVELLASKAGIPIPEEQKQRQEDHSSKDKKKHMLEVNQLTAEFYHHNLMKIPEDHPAKAYLNTRGFTEETIKTFQIGYAPEEWEALRQFLDSKRASLKVAEELGLLKARSKGKSGHFDLFRNRLMFPIVSHKDEYVGFGGRVVSAQDNPKYLNSPDSEVFHKGALFYGLKDAAKYIRTQDKIVIVEGYTDYLALYQAGIQCVAATLGTALTPQHAKLIKRHTRNVFVLFDGDEAGQNAAERSLKILLNEGLFPRGLVLPEGQDPDDFLKANGPKALGSELKRSPELFELVLRKTLKGFTGVASEKVTLLDKLAPILLCVKDRRLQDLYIDSVATRLNVETGWIMRGLRAQEKASKANEKNSSWVAPVSTQAAENTDKFSQSPATISLDKVPKNELELINVALMSPKYLEQILNSGVTEKITHQGVRQVLLLIADRYRQLPNKFDSLTAYLQTRVEPHEHVARHLRKPLSELGAEGAKKLLNDCLRSVKAARLRALQKEVTLKLRNRSSQESNEELEQIMNIHRDRLSLNREQGPSD